MSAGLDETPSDGRGWCRHWIDRCGTPAESSDAATVRVWYAAMDRLGASLRVLRARRGEPASDRAAAALHTQIIEVYERDPYLVRLRAQAGARSEDAERSVATFVAHAAGLHVELLAPAELPGDRS